jgi:hypothetical protein
LDQAFVASNYSCGQLENSIVKKNGLVISPTPIQRTEKRPEIFIYELAIWRARVARAREIL